jgi:hypothetical protein
MPGYWYSKRVTLIAFPSNSWQKPYQLVCTALNKILVKMMGNKK